MRFFQKQICLVDFDPSVGHEYRKVRPALIIEDDAYINSNNLLTVLPVSSVTGKPKPLDVLIPKDSGNRLMKDSLIKTHQISSFDKRRFIKHIGVCSDAVFELVQENLSKYLSLDSK